MRRRASGAAARTASIRSADGPGIGHADGVGDRDLGHAQRGGLAGDGHDLVLRHLAVERTAEGDRDRRGDRRTALDRLAFGDGGQRVDLLAHRGALVGDAEAVRGADHDIGLVAAGRDAALPAAHVEHEADPRVFEIRR
jgi:hypothetical protein